MNPGQNPYREHPSEFGNYVDQNVGPMSVWSSDTSMDPGDEEFLLRSASYQTTSNNDASVGESSAEHDEIVLVDEEIVPVQRICSPSTHGPQQDYVEPVGETSHQPNAILFPQSLPARSIPQDDHQHPPWSSNMPDDVNQGSLELYSPLRGHLPQEIIRNSWTTPEPENEGASASKIIPDLVMNPLHPAGDDATYPSELESLSGSPVSATDDSWIGTGNTKPVASFEPRRNNYHHCSSCQQSFVDARGLRRHMTSAHSGHKPYTCRVPQCAYSRHGVHGGFARRDSLRRHERKKHFARIDNLFPTDDVG